MRKPLPSPAQHQGEPSGDLALPRSLAALPATLPMPRSKRLPLAEHGLLDGPALEFVDAPAPDKPGEVLLANLPRWMRALPERGPPGEEQAQAAHGAAQHDRDELPPEG